MNDRLQMFKDKINNTEREKEKELKYKNRGSTGPTDQDKPNENNETN